MARKRATAYPEIGPLIARCLDPDPRARPAAAQVAAELAQAAPPVPRPTPTPRPARERPEPDALLAGRYRVVRPLGEGAWAVTWLARDEQRGQDLVLKHLRPGRVGPEQVRAEYRHGDRLRSRYCAKVYDMLDRPEPGVLVQEYVPGRNLAEIAAGSRRLDQEQARRIAHDVLCGLADAHQQALYHRDVSPSNIIVGDDGRAKLIDFGLASPVEDAQSAVGSPPFTAPEVWTRRRWSPAADIYSAAASILFAMLSRYPYAGPGMDERDILVRPTDADVQRFGRSLLDTLYRAVAPEPADRPQDAAAFAEEVLRARDMSVRDGQYLVNPTVDALRSLYRRSSLGNAGNRGLDEAFAHDTYRPTKLDTVLVPAIRDGLLDVVVLSGNPGDGKTSFLVNLADELDKAGAIRVDDDAAGWRRRLDGRTFVAVYDASESHGTLSSDEPAAPGPRPRPPTTIPLCAPSSSRPTTDASPSSSASTPPVTRRSPPQLQRQRTAPATTATASSWWISNAARWRFPT